MQWLYQPLLLLLASSTDSDLEKQVDHLRAENQILRSRLGKGSYLSEPEKRLLVRFGQAVSRGIKDLLNDRRLRTRRPVRRPFNAPSQGLGPPSIGQGECVAGRIGVGWMADTAHTGYRDPECPYKAATVSV